MKKPTTEAPKYRNAEIPASSHFRFPISNFSFAVVRGPLTTCYRSNTPCDRIHSEDTHLFRIMKNSHFSFCHPSISAFQFLLSALAILALCGCTGTRALRGGKAFTARNSAGGVSQVLLQGENPSAPSRQAQETVRVRTYTVPAGTRVEQFLPSTNQLSTIHFFLSQHSNTPILRHSTRLHNH